MPKEEHSCAALPWGQSFFYPSQLLALLECPDASFLQAVLGQPWIEAQLFCSFLRLSVKLKVQRGFAALIFVMGRHTLSHRLMAICVLVLLSFLQQLILIL